MSNLLIDVATSPPSEPEQVVVSSAGRSFMALSKDGTRVVHARGSNELALHPLFTSLTTGIHVSFEEMTTNNWRYFLVSSGGDPEPGEAEGEVWRASRDGRDTQLVWTSFGLRTRERVSLVTTPEGAFLCSSDDSLLAFIPDEGTEIRTELVHGQGYRVVNASTSGALVQNQVTREWFWWAPPSDLELLSIQGDRPLASVVIGEAVVVALAESQRVTVVKIDEHGSSELWQGSNIRGLRSLENIVFWWTEHELWAHDGMSRLLRSSNNELRFSDFSAATNDALHLWACDGLVCELLAFRRPELTAIVLSQSMIAFPVPLVATPGSLWFVNSRGELIQAPSGDVLRARGEVGDQAALLAFVDGVAVVEMKPIRATFYPDSGGSMSIDLQSPKTASSWPTSFVPVADKLVFVSLDGFDGTDVPGIRVSASLRAWDGANLEKLNEDPLTGFYASPDGEILWATYDAQSSALHQMTSDRTQKVWMGPSGRVMRFPEKSGPHISVTIGNELWVVDSARDQLQLRLTVSERETITSRVAIGSDLFATSGPTMWRLRDTVAEVAFESPSSTASRILGVTGDRLVLLVCRGVEGVLWLSDGTPAGTSMLSSRPLRCPTARGVPFGSQLLVVDGLAAYVVADTARQLVGSDFDGGEGLTVPAVVTLSDQEAFFTIEDEQSGLELWRTNGAREGTTLAKDINLGARGSQIAGMTSVGTHVLFWAFDGRAWSVYAAGGTTVNAITWADPPFQGRGAAGESQILAAEIIGATNREFALFGEQIVTAAFDRAKGAEPHAFSVELIECGGCCTDADCASEEACSPAMCSNGVCYGPTERLTCETEMPGLVETDNGCSCCASKSSSSTILLLFVAAFVLRSRRYIA